MYLIALWIGKCSLLGLRLFRRRGAALPGLIVESLYPRFLAKVLYGLPEGVVVVTGTNGKTTTTKVITSVLEQSGRRVLTNPTGSNFTRGIVASIVAEADWSGRLARDIAILELDEAYAVRFVGRVKPRGVLLLNVMRDQMDRFAEIDHTARLLQEVARSAREFIVYNNDDTRVAVIGEARHAKSVSFGAASSLRSKFIYDDELHAAHQLTPKEGKKGADICLVSFRSGEIELRANDQNYRGKVQLEGLHNALNATAALATVTQVGVALDTSIALLENIQPAFGRGEHIFIRGRKIVLQLVKNPGGFRSVLQDIESLEASAMLVAINDDYADGRDVSWLWDVDFHCLRPYVCVSTSGTRAADMALRLAYDEVDVQWAEASLDRALKRIIAELNPGQTGVIYTTYTAMLYLRGRMAKKTEVMKV